jgi:hypothetical protein
MTGNDPDPRMPNSRPESPASPVDRTIEASTTGPIVQGAEASPPDALQANTAPLSDILRPPADPSVTAPRLGGGISLMVTFLGLIGAAVGAGWLGLDSRYGLSPAGWYGGILTLAAAGLAVLGLLLVNGGLGY